MEEELDMPDSGADDFDELLAEKRHKELIASLGKISAYIAGGGEQREVVTAINSLGVKISGFIAAQKAPVVTVNSDSKEVAQSVDAMQKDIVSGINELKVLLGKEGEKKNWEVTVNRGSAGYIEKLIFTQK